MLMWRVGVDVGGTFTDLVARSGGGATIRIKVPSTPRAPGDGFIAALRSLLAEIDAATIEYVGHATTIATNALLGQVHLELPRVVFVTTAGFRDVVEIGRQNRSALYDLGVRRPRPLAARDDRIGVCERLAYDGSVLMALDDEAIAQTIAAVRERAPVSIAIGFLNSHVDDVHERRMSAALAAAFPGVPVTASAALVREEREYERFSTALVNATLMPIVGTYLDAVAKRVRDLGIAATVHVMQSNGGTVPLAAAALCPAAGIESGPAAGAIAAASVGAALGLERVLSFDMGGTTAKAGTIVDGTPLPAYEFEAAGATHSGRAIRGSGYPVRFPFVDLAEVSAGGGSIAHLDAAGVLRVGPLSAGADPGPACFGRGERPTVTDANVVLGRLNAQALLGGTFPIDAARSHAAIAAVAEPLGGDVIRTAAGIVALVDAEMAKVLRIVSVERGLDPRTFSLVAFGGGGPAHACALAEDLGIARVIVPEHPGLLSALGLVTAPTMIARSQSYVTTLDARTLAAAHDIAEALASDALATLHAHAVVTDITLAREVDLRYVGQSFDLTLLLDDDVTLLTERFHARHQKRYGYAARSEALEIATIRVTARGGGSSETARTHHAPPNSHGDVRRDVWDRGRFVSTPVLRRESLQSGTRVCGPAIVEHYDATTWIPSGWHARVDGLANLHLERELR